MVDIDEFLKASAAQGLLRSLNSVSSRGQGKIYFGGKEYIDFSSNDYLGLSAHPRLIAESKKAAEIFGTSNSASRLMGVDPEIYCRLEEKTAQFKHKEAALVFNSGYQANIGIVSSLYGKDDCIFLDRYSHASIIDGVTLSGAKFFRFQHNDTIHLETLLQRNRAKFKQALIITESVFSMDGDKAPLADLVGLKERYNASLMVDEAHATGIYGPNGSGWVEEAGLSESVELIMGTFSKALGSFGAYLASSKKIVNYLINTCRSFIYSTALPPAVVAVNLASIDLVKVEPKRRTVLLENARFFRDSLEAKGFKVMGDSQIVPLLIADNFKAIEFSRKLQEKGYWVLPIRPPTVRAGLERLRFSLSYYHDKIILKQLIDDISKVKI